MNSLPIIRNSSLHQQPQSFNIRKMRYSESHPDRIGDEKNRLRVSSVSISRPFDKTGIKEEKNYIDSQIKLIKTKKRPTKPQSLFQVPKLHSNLRINQDQRWRQLNICKLLNETQSYEHYLMLWKQNIMQESIPSLSEFNKIVVLHHQSGQVYRFELLTHTTLKASLQYIHSHLKNMKVALGVCLYSGIVFDDDRVESAFFWTARPVHNQNLSEVLYQVAKQLQFFLHPNLEEDKKYKIQINNVWGTPSYVELINLKSIIQQIRQEVCQISQIHQNISENSKLINKIWNSSSRKQQGKLLKL